MNKIKSLLKGSSIAMVVAGILIAGVASAALVNYLSNPAKTTATVSSPIEMSINMGRDGNTVGNKSIDVDTTGGSDFTFTTIAENKANNDIEGFPVIVVQASTGDKLTGEEFTRVLFDDGTKDGNITETDIIGGWDITDLLHVVERDGSLTKLSSKTWDNEKLVLYFDNDPTNGICNPAATYPLEAGEVNWNVLKMTLADNVVGTYKIYTQYANDLAEYATGQYE